MGAPSEPVAILSFSYVGIIQIRYKGRSSQLPLSLSTNSPFIHFYKSDVRNTVHSRRALPAQEMYVFHDSLTLTITYRQ